MTRWKILCLLLVLQNYVIASDSQPDRKRCLTVAEKIRKLNSQLRQANTVTRSEKLKDRLRQWKKLRYQCRKRRFPIK